MENWSTCIAICSSTPSSCVATSFSYPYPLTILAVGSPHVYIIDSKLKKCLAVIKFPRAVMHVSTLYSVQELEMCTVVCCLRDLVMVFNVASVLPSSHKASQDSSPSVSDEDFLDTLFGGKSMEPTTTAAAASKTSTSTLPVRILDSSVICEGIALCPVASWELMAASVVKNNLVLFRKCLATQAVSCLLVKSSNNVSFSLGSREIRIPSFISARPIQSFVIDSGRNIGSERVDTGTRRTLHVKPVFTVVQSADHPWRRCTNIAAKFYLTLFGPETALAKEPVLVMGTLNGKVYFTNFTSNSTEDQSGARGGDVLGPLCDIQQPVVGLHWVYFPPDDLVSSDDAVTVSWDMDVEGSTHERPDETPNTLICVGQRGRVMLCYYDPIERKCLHSVVEYQVPGPVLSSSLAPKQCLLFTTLNGLYRICLRQDCARCVEEKIPNWTGHACSVKIPHVSFSFPEKVLVARRASYILRTREADEYYQADSAAGSSLIQCTYVRVDGSITTTELCVHTGDPGGQTGPVSRRQSAEHVGKEIKQCLDSIRVTSERLSKTKSSIEGVDRALRELKDNLALLCTVAGVCGKSCDLFNSFAPFTCSFTSDQRDQGLRIKKLFADLTITYKRPKNESFPHKLGPGWTCLVQSAPIKDSGFSLSKFLSISGMAAEDSVSVRTEVGHEDLQLPVMMHCFLCYSPQMLCDSATSHSSNNPGPGCMTHSGISLHMCSKMITVLDFATHSKQSHDTSKMSLSSFNATNLRHILKNNVPSSLAIVGPIHCVTLPISSVTAIRIILARSTASVKEDLVNLDKKLLTIKLMHSIIPPHHQVVRGKDASRGDEVMICSVVDSPSFSLEVRDKAGVHGAPTEQSLLLVVKSRSKQCIVEIISSIHSFLNHYQSIGKSESKQIIGSGKDLESHNPVELSEKAEKFKIVARKVSGMREELSRLQQQLKITCLPLNMHDQQLKSMKSRMFSAFCKLRELHDV